MGINNQENIIFPIWIILQILAIGISVYILLNNSKGNIIGLLPIVFIIVSTIFYKVYTKIFSSVLYLFYLSTAYIRFVIVPLFMVIANYDMDFFIRDEVYNNLNWAILLMGYELFCIFGILYLHAKHKKNIEFPELKIKSPCKASSFMVGILFITLCLILFTHPSMSLFLHANASVVEEQWAIKDMIKELHSSTNPYIFWGFRLILGILQVTFPIFIYNWAYLKLSKRKSLMIGILMVLLSLVIMTDAKAVSVFVATNLLIVIIRTQGKRVRLFVPFLVGIIGLVFTAALTKDQGFSGSQWAHLSTVLQGYFAGPLYTAGTFVIYEDVTFNEIIKDIFTPIPFLGMFVVDYVSTNELANNAIFGSSLYGIIFPMLGEGVRMVTLAFAPLFSIVTILLGIKIENHFKMQVRRKKILDITNLYFNYYVLMILGVAVNMYDFSILIGFLVNFLIIYFVLNAPIIRHINIRFR